jgi:hypothetical protein
MGAAAMGIARSASKSARGNIVGSGEGGGEGLVGEGEWGMGWEVAERCKSEREVKQRRVMGDARGDCVHG